MVLVQAEEKARDKSQQQVPVMITYLFCIQGASQSAGCAAPAVKQRRRQRQQVQQPQQCAGGSAGRLRRKPRGMRGSTGGRHPTGVCELEIFARVALHVPSQPLQVSSCMFQMSGCSIVLWNAQSHRGTTTTHICALRVDNYKPQQLCCVQALVQAANASRGAAQAQALLALSAIVQGVVESPGQQQMPLFSSPDSLAAAVQSLLAIMQVNSVVLSFSALPVESAKCMWGM